jgi:Protein of unknown function (DUF1822)
MSNEPLLNVNLPISSLARHTAQQFAEEQVTLHKARQTFLNTLSVWAVHDYLALMDVTTDLNQGDSWNPLMRHCADVADLVVSGMGRLECRALFGSAVSCSVPQEAWWERIAYVFVQIHPSYAQATLLGFSLRVEQVEVLTSALQPMDAFFVYLHQLRQNSSILAGKYVLLRDWLAGHDTDDWLDLPELLAQIKWVSFRWQSEGDISIQRAEPLGVGVSRGKFIPLGFYLIPLTIQIEPIKPHRCNVVARVFPCSGSCLIPEGLILSVLDSVGNIVLQAQARQQDGLLQLRFSGAMDEVFQVRLSLDDLWVTKTFMI